MGGNLARKVQPIYEFGGFRLDVGERLLLKNGEPVPLQPKAFDVLWVLVQNPGRLLEKEQLLKAVWPDAVVEEVNLANNISILRKVLGESDAMRFIETVPRRGYRFLGRPVALISDDNACTELNIAAARGNCASPSAGTSESRAAGPFTKWIISAWFLWLSIGGLTLLMVATFFRFVPRSSETTLSTGRLVRVTSDAGLTAEPALSPDASLLAYSSDRGGGDNLDIWIQPLNGSAPLRLTDHEANDSQPDFSPDGASIVFRSERDGGGIYVVPTLGGAARMIATGGTRPRFSPDGRYIAYWNGDIDFYGPGDLSAPGTSRIFVVPASGGEPRQLCPDFAGARLPTWSPDGKKILFVGVRDPSRSPMFARPEILDWWITPVDGGPPIKTGAYAAFALKGASLAIPNVWVAGRGWVLSAASSGDSRNLWRIPISPKHGEVLGEAERLTSGAAFEADPLLAGRRLVFSSLNRTQNIWSLPIRSDDGHPIGDVRPLVTNAASDGHPYISADGRTIAFSSTRSGNRDIWVKDLDTGIETPVTTTPLNERWPVLSGDGSRVAFAVAGSDKSPVYVAPLRGGVFEKVCDDCARFDDWSSDGMKMLYHWAERRRVGLLDLTSGRQIDILAHPRHNLYQPHFSRDNQWITFLEQLDPNHRRLWIAPAGGEGLRPETSWIPVTGGEYSDDKPRFSPSGNLIYFTSDRDGFMCLWAQRLHPQSKRPVGSPLLIRHFHSSRLSLRNVSLVDLEISVATDKIVFNLGELTGNIWMAEFDGASF